jgi:phosphoglycolate phosphatase
VYGCELDGTRSNKAELLTYAIAENPEATSMTMVGDRRHDMSGAVANAMTPVGVSYGYGSISELTAAGAVLVAGDPAELVAMLASES